MVGRIRTLTRPDVTGTRFLYGGLTTKRRAGGVSKCTDVVGLRHQDNILQISHSLWYKGLILDGIRYESDGKVFAQWANYPVSLAFSTKTSNPAVLPGEMVSALTAYNLTNPGRHAVLLPAFAAELRDLPALLRYSGRVLNNMHLSFQAMLQGLTRPNGLKPELYHKLRRANLLASQQSGLSVGRAVAALNLSWQFGWAPLIGDVSKMIGLSDAINSRRKEINRLYSGKGLKRKVTLEDAKSTYDEESFYIDTVAGVVETTRHDYRHVKRWATVRWKPKSPSSLPPSDADIARNLLGLDGHGVVASVWEALPWSWFIDYFTNVGDIIDSWNNSMEVIGRVCVMTTIERRVTCPGGFADFGKFGYKSISSGSLTTSTKSRFVTLTVPGGLKADIPILGNNQLSILSSILMLRGR